MYPERRRFKIRNTDRFTDWYLSRSRRSLDGPPAHLLRPARGSLYAHRHANGTQVWLYVVRDKGKEKEEGGSKGKGRAVSLLRPRVEGKWERIYPGTEHPDLEGYVLHIIDRGHPRWVKEQTARAYAEKRGRDL